MHRALDPLGALVRRWPGPVALFGLGLSLFAAGLIILLIIVFALRSPVLGLFSVLPNVFPLAATAALLVIVGMPIQYTSVMLFTICLGIAVDDTIHFLVRYRKLRSAGVASDPAVRQTLREVGAVLVTTTLIMVGSFLVLQESELPMIRLFGVICALALAWAVIGDLIFLPAVLAWWGRRRREGAVGDWATARGLPPRYSRLRKNSSRSSFRRASSASSSSRSRSCMVTKWLLSPYFFHGPGRTSWRSAKRQWQRAPLRMPR